jgi:DNA-binding NtrC family response regulator
MTSEPTTILIAVEEPDMVSLLRQALEADGCCVVSTSPEQSLTLVKSTPSLRMIISDLSMAGVELIRRACRSRPELRVLFVTDGLDNTAFRQSDPVLLKPFKVDTFLNVVRRTLAEPDSPVAIDWGLGPERRRMAAH